MKGTPVSRDLEHKTTLRRVLDGVSRFTWPACEGRLQDRVPSSPGRSSVCVLQKGWG